LRRYAKDRVRLQWRLSFPIAVTEGFEVYDLAMSRYERDASRERVVIDVTLQRGIEAFDPA
jgi:hypothetical protein